MSNRKDNPYVIGVIGGIAKNLCNRAKRLPRHGETFESEGFEEHNGGKGANTAIAAFRLSHLRPDLRSDSMDVPQNSLGAPGFRGIDVHMTGAVGNDRFGPDLKDALERNFIQSDKVEILDGVRTGINTVIVCPSGDSHVIFTPNANHKLPPEAIEKPTDLACNANPDLVILQLEVGLELVEKVLKVATVSRIDVLLNASPGYSLGEENYRELKHLLINPEEAAILTGWNVENFRPGFDWNQVTDELLDKGVKNVVIMLGKDGAFYSQSNGMGGYIESVTQDSEIDDMTGAE